MSALIVAAVAATLYATWLVWISARAIRRRK